MNWKPASREVPLTAVAASILTVTLIGVPAIGMAQSFADFDSDGQLDLLAIGMSSSTARRLDSLGLGREDRQDYQQNRYQSKGPESSGAHHNISFA